MASSEEDAGVRVHGEGAVAPGSTDISAHGSGVGAVSMLSELVGEDVPHARLGEVRGCMKEPVVDVHMQRSVKPEPRVRPTQVFAPRQRSIKPVPRMRHVSEEAANVIGRQYDAVVGPFDQDTVNSRHASGVVIVATGYPFESSHGDIEMSNLPSLDHLPSNVAQEFPAFGDVDFNRANPSEEGVRDDENLLHSYASSNRSSVNEQSSVVTAGTMFLSTFVTLPDTLVFSDTSDEEA
eukprot:TRINITY_DN11413_c1_g1_i1.p1 TRINITY_DN11413_c1_g1~~TRINITY_DN11413_c1_g1_i1.p1  ORF type:complete len:237 (+),score=38.31 TRINITY_DN11413_c1_g1_i1:58-768(+)